MPADRPRRLDIQGLRAVASLLVASYHVWFGNVSGGVDVFFAVGGYLLAASLVREVERSGRIGIGQALWRTAKRLFPMAGIVLVVAGTTMLVVAGPLGAERALGDIFASATYWENWRLAADATEYVAAGHDKSPLQHFWAMGAQGQYTAMCIIAMGLLALALGARAKDRMRVAAAVLLAVVAIASFAYAVVRLDVAPIPTYYDTFARAWELAIGGFVAVALSRWSIPGALRVVMGLVGIALVLTAGLLPVEWLQPGPVTLWPVVGALLILRAGEGDDRHLVGRLLQWRPLVFIGGISYGIYLWHWPVLKAFIAAFPAAGAEIDALEGLGIIVLSIALSWLSYRVIALAMRARGRRAKQRSAIAFLVPVVAVASSAGMLVVPQLQRQAIAEEQQSQPRASDESQLDRWIAAAVDEPSVPEEGAKVGWEALPGEWLVDGCLTVEPEQEAQCRFDDAPDSDREVWIVGDSQAVTWAAPVRSVIAGRADLQLLGRSMCAFSQGPVVAAQVGDLGPTCDAHAQRVQELAAERMPDLVLVSYGAWWVGNGYENRAEDSGAQLAAGTLELAEPLLELGIPVAFLDSPPPVSMEPSACLEAHAAGGDLADCTYELQQEQVRRHQELTEGLSAGGVDAIETLPWFCDVDAMACPLVVQGVPTWADKSHMGLAGAMLREEALARELEPLLELPEG